MYLCYGENYTLKVKKTVAVLLIVLFVISVTATSVSASYNDYINGKNTGYGVGYDAGYGVGYVSGQGERTLKARERTVEAIDNSRKTEHHRFINHRIPRNTLKEFVSRVRGSRDFKNGFVKGCSYGYYDGHSDGYNKGIQNKWLL